jgi:hypothetical protein
MFFFILLVDELYNISLFVTSYVRTGVPDADDLIGAINNPGPVPFKGVVDAFMMIELEGWLLVPANIPIATEILPWLTWPADDPIATH